MTPSPLIAGSLVAGLLAGLTARRLPASGLAALMLVGVPPVAAYYALGAC